ncbi:HNH endonuclease [Clostridium beijerinckii]|nr:HNH endonuclease [Clostridium beijerinckii]AQS05896.1 HNH endonuclease [Clostridium beijerinckii]NRS97366.1 uncharacterized protein (TIGR02646 family) [Clostridium beijerinckii]NRT80579.1 uncharacterized protein (TIGR02646 family) [Clostridium beijerinckii]NRU27090.1 uncharacterized protein (TIGR02646 family) [Clostridium beijerinckii]NRU63215.1 uncharacterized protein (TIGR02646 family) [Clostridium beijerinckii]
MIKLSKLPKPKILVDHAKQWTKEYCDCLSRGIKPSPEIASRYNNPIIKSTLERETNGKCAYCESKIKHNSYGDIEHILPKNVEARPDLYVEWTNLTLACEQCNRTGKRTYYNPAKPLINPYEDDPDEHFQVLGPMICYKPGDERAFITENKLNLNRSELITRRSERISSVEKLLFSWEQATEDTIRDIISDQLLQECMPDKEFSFVIKYFLIARGFPIDSAS